MITIVFLIASQVAVPPTGPTPLGPRGGVALSLLDGRYLRLDGSNDHLVTADINLPLGFSVDTTTLVVDETTNRVGIGIAPLVQFHVSSTTTSSTPVFIHTIGELDAGQSGAVVRADLNAGVLHGATVLAQSDAAYSPIRYGFSSGAGIALAHIDVRRGDGAGSGTGAQMRFLTRQTGEPNAYDEPLRLDQSSVIVNPGSTARDLVVNTDTVAAVTIQGASTSTLVSGVAAGNSDGDVLWSIVDDLDIDATAAGGIITLHANGSVGIGVDGTKTNPDFSVTWGSNNMSSPEEIAGTGKYWRMPSIVNSAPVKPACADETEGAFLYVDDTDDATAGQMCTCNASVDRATFNWLNQGGAACAGT
jgi:hypothetical protein